jgi:hypothetical protein
MIGTDGLAKQESFHFHRVRREVDAAQLARFLGRWERIPGPVGALSSSERLLRISLDSLGHL